MSKIYHLSSLFILVGFLNLAAQPTLNLPSISASCSEIIYIPVTVQRFDSLTGVQFSVQWDPAVLAYSFEAEGAYVLDNATTLLTPQLAEEGVLSFRWESITPLSLMNGDTILYFPLQVLETAETITVVRFSDTKAAIKVTDTNGTVVPRLNDGTITLSSNTIPPVVINCPDTVVQYTTALSCEIEGLWEVPNFSTCNGTLDIRSSLMMGTTLEVGSRVITYTATDALGAATTCSFVHILRDTIAPVISNCPENMEVNFSKEEICDLSVTWSPPIFLERCSSTETIVESNFDPGGNFPVGKSIVTYTATDIDGNSSQCSFEVIVTGSDPITFDKKPENVVINALPGECGATYDWGSPPAAISGCAPVTLIANFESGSFFPVGTTVVEYVATDQINQRAIWAFSITVKDDQAIAARCPTDIVIAANGTVMDDSLSFVQTVSAMDCATYQLSFNDIEVLDNCIASINQELIQGKLTDFTKGTTQMEYMISNASGETTSCVFQITIEEAPALSIEKGMDLACVDTDFPLWTDSTAADFYDTWQWTGPNGYTSTEQNPILTLAPELEGQFTLTAFNAASACSATASIDLEVFGESGTPIIETEKVVLCEGESFSLRTIGTPGAMYTWTGPNEFSTEQLAITVDNALSEQTGNYELTRTVEGCTSEPSIVRLIVLSEMHLNDDVVNTFINNSFEFEVVSNDTFEIDAPYTITTFPESTSGILINNEDGSFSYTPNEDFVGTEQISYEICYETCPDLCSSGIITIRTALSDEKCTFPTFLSPNGDGQNEELFFSCNTGDIADSGIIIFNQWGAKVYEAFPYTNDWQGTYKGEPLPDGTYYYIYQAMANDPNPIKNCVTIFR